MASINVNCACGNQFVTEEPTADSGFTVECPTCGARIRIKPPGISHKQFKAATAALPQLSTKGYLILFRTFLCGWLFVPLQMGL